MKFTHSLLAVAIALPALAPDGQVTAETATSGPDLSADATFANSYSFRGAELWDVATVFPSATIAQDLGFAAGSFSVWAAVPLQDREQLEIGRDEIDFTATLGWEVGAIVYVLPNADPKNTEEAFVAASYDVGGGFGVGGGVNYDFDQFNGAYAVLSPGWGTDLGAGVSLSVGGTAAYAKYEGADGALIEPGANAGLGQDLGSGFSAGVGGFFNRKPDSEENQNGFSVSIGYGG